MGSNPTASSTLMTKDPKKRAAQNRRYYAANRAAQYQRVNRRKAELRIFVREAKERPCADCKVQYPYYVMQFDHRGDKKFNLSWAYRMAGFNQIKAEIEKCDVVCANCHAERTHRRRPSRMRAAA